MKDNGKEEKEMSVGKGNQSLASRLTSGRHQDQGPGIPREPKFMVGIFEERSSDSTIEETFYEPRMKY